MSHALQQEIASLREQLDIANATISDMRKAESERVEPLIGVARLTKNEAGLVAIVARGGRVTFERVYSALYNHLDEPRAYRTIKVVMCKARQKLRPHGITIKSIFAVGFEMDDESRSALRHLASLPRIDSPSVCPVEQVAA